MGHVEGIFVAESTGGLLTETPEARAIPGRGLEGDRYFQGTGQFSKKPGARELTLIEAEAIEALARDYDMHLAPGETRRNIVTRGVALNHLVGKDFTVGDVRVHGVKLCEPCNYLETTTERPGIRTSLSHRGGLRVQILDEGVIRKGDPIRTLEAP